MADHLQSNTNVTGHLEKRREHWHMVLNWYSLVGTRKRKCKSTGLPVKGNKKRAEQMLAEFILNFEQSMESKPSGDLLLFADFLEYTWFVEKENSKSIRVTTLACYETVVKAIVAPYFREKEIALIDLTEEDIEEFYAFRLQTVKATTVHKDHVVINSAIKMALRKNLISRNMMSFVSPPKKQRFQAQFFAESEVIRLFEVAKGHELELAIILGAYYGLRRSEVVGLRWSAINFEAETLSIEHTITKTTLHGKRITCAEDLGKSDTSLRTLPLVPAFKNKLLEIKLEQQKCQKSFGRSYNKKNAAYVYKDPLGELIDPDHITESFPKFLEKHEFRRIRFHDLRHSCASLLLANDVPLIKVSDWLGHSEISVTADIYGHLEYKSKIESANAMTWLSQTSLGKEFDPEREDVSTHEYGQKNNQPILAK